MIKSPYLGPRPSKLKKDSILLASILKVEPKILKVKPKKVLFFFHLEALGPGYGNFVIF